VFVRLNVSGTLYNKNITKEMRNKLSKEIAECAKCGTVIEFATSEEFEKLVDEHIHTYPLG
jgi:hypothetical protein